MMVCTAGQTRTCRPALVGRGGQRRLVKVHPWLGWPSLAAGHCVLRPLLPPEQACSQRGCSGADATQESKACEALVTGPFYLLKLTFAEVSA